MATGAPATLQGLGSQLAIYGSAPLGVVSAVHDGFSPPAAADTYADQPASPVETIGRLFAYDVRPRTTREIGGVYQEFIDFRGDHPMMKSLELRILKSAIESPHAEVRLRATMQTMKAFGATELAKDSLVAFALHLNEKAEGRAFEASQHVEGARFALKDLGYNDGQIIRLLSNLMNVSSMNSATEIIAGIPLAAKAVAQRISQGEEWSGVDFADLLVESTRQTRGFAYAAFQNIGAALKGLEKAHVKSEDDPTRTRLITNKEKIIFIAHALYHMQGSNNYAEYIPSVLKNLGAAVSATALLTKDNGEKLTAVEQAKWLQKMAGTGMHFQNLKYLGLVYENLPIIVGALNSHRNKFQNAPGDITQAQLEFAGYLLNAVNDKNIEPMARALGTLLHANFTGIHADSPLGAAGEVISDIAAEYYDTLDVASRAVVKLSQLGYSLYDIREILNDSAIGASNRIAHEQVKERPRLASENANNVRAILNFIQYGDPFRIKLLVRTIRSRPFKNSANLLRVLN